MILETKCKNCDKTIRFHSFASDRLELSRLKKYTKLDLQCKKCNAVDKYDINQIYAKFKLIKLISVSMMVTYLILLIAIAPRYWSMIWDFPAMGTVMISSLLLTPFVVFVMINNNIETSQRRFNSSRI